MKKQLLTSEEEYFNYCVENRIGDIVKTIRNGATTQSNYIGKDNDSEPCVFFHTYETKNTVENLSVKRKPTHYPCFICWYLQWDDCNTTYRGGFIYKEDFENPKKP